MKSTYFSVYFVIRWTVCAYEPLGMPVWTAWVRVCDCCTREQWWTLVFSPKRACLA